MSEFVVTGADMFGRYCLIEQKNYFSPNEVYIYKVVSSLRSNCWCEVPYKTGTHEVLHDSIEDCVLAICCGVDETYVQRFRMADVELLPSATCDRDALLALANEMGRVRSRCDFCIKKGDCDWADETVCLESRIDDFAVRIREACGEVEPCDERS